MKMRVMTILYTAVLLLIGVLSFFTIGRISSQQLDMVAINTSFKQMEERLEETREEDWGELAKKLESQYPCVVILRQDPDYQAKLTEALKSGDIILDYEHQGRLAAKICFTNGSINFEAQKRKLSQIVLGAVIGVWGLGILLFYYFYRGYVAPFRKLQNFAAEVARGNLDMPLSMTKSNYFGVFTESFDLMREELRKAKENEYRANVSKKELVAELSHDIKTPVATIKAACEIIDTKVENQLPMDQRELQEKIHLIEKKSQVVEQLVSNLFHATLEELEVLKVEPQEELSTCIEEMFHELKDYGNIHLENQVPHCLIWMDKLRTTQVIDNIINNALKYAKTDIHVSFVAKEDGIIIRIKDDGPGVPKEDLAKVSEKFYRGGNATGENGSGLGLYLARMFMDKMGGQMECYNDNGFVVELYLKKVVGH